MRFSSFRIWLAAGVLAAVPPTMAGAEATPREPETPPTAHAGDRFARPALLSALRAEGRRYRTDAVSIGSAPLHWTPAQWSRFAAAAGVVVALGTQDERISAEFARGRSASTDRASKLVTPFGAWVPVGVSAGMLGGGLLFRDVSLRDTGRDAIEAEIFAAGIVTPLLKTAFGRARPDQSHGEADEFRPFSSGRSFPSGHATEAFAVASVIAARSHGWVVPTLAYSLASGVALARVNDRVHFASDVVAGALIGTVIGRAVVHRRAPPEESAGAWSVAPLASARGVGLAFSVSLDAR